MTDEILAEGQYTITIRQKVRGDGRKFYNIVPNAAGLSELEAWYLLENWLHLKRERLLGRLDALDPEQDPNEEAD